MHRGSIHFIQHEEHIGPGAYLVWAERNGWEASTTRCWAGDRPPASGPLPDLLVVLGGPQNPATTKQRCPYFDAAAEREFIRRCVDAGRAVIGVCLGAQLLGEALGAAYAPSPEPEIGPVRITLTEAGRADPFLKSLPDIFPGGEWHNDMPGLTATSTVLAASEGCPRQIVRYGRFVYGLQTHMEFTHEIVAGLLARLSPALRRRGAYIQSDEELLAYDYTEMNARLWSFLDALTEAWQRASGASIPALLEKMIAFSEGNIHDIDHLIRVWTYARTIGGQEGLDPGTQYVLEAAAIVHDIACPLCRAKYGNTNGKYQEAEGAPMAAAFLREAGVDEEKTARIAYLVGHHHTFTDVDGLDYQILLEADYLANASENEYTSKAVAVFRRKFCRTLSGRRLLGTLFGLTEE